MKWMKEKLIFEPTGEPEWMKTHGQVPTVLVLDDRFRVYVSSRPHQQCSLTGIIDLDKHDPSKILKVYQDPVLSLGKPGTFDEFGVMPSSVIKKDNVVFLYYTGWTRGATVPYLNAVGLAISEDNGLTFRRYSEGPIVERRHFEPFSAMSPYVLHENGRWHMWYSSGVDWFKTSEKYEPIYLIKYAKSQDGIHWDQTNMLAIHPKTKYEAATRASVFRAGDTYHMWFCYRGSEDFRGGQDSYRIGYASSKDLVNWKREDEKAGIDVSESGWDSIMVEYPYIVKDGDDYLMFYNGNGFGSNGFGYARMGAEALF